MAHSKDLRQRVGQFKLQQNDVDRRLMIVTHSETSDDAVQKFNHSMENLRKLDVAQQYMGLLKEVESLRSITNVKAIYEVADTNMDPTALRHAVILKSLLERLCSHISSYRA